MEKLFSFLKNTSVWLEVRVRRLAGVFPRYLDTRPHVAEIPPHHRDPGTATATLGPYFQNAEGGSLISETINRKLTY